MEFDIISPKTKAELLQSIRENKNNFRFGAGYTDLLLELKKKKDDNITVINLAQLKDKKFTSICKINKYIRVGALVTASSIIENTLIEQNFLVLKQAAINLASSQIRHVATVGGNICTASPSGDIACALVALKATCELLSTTGNSRLVPIREFYTGPRQTVMKKKEVLRCIFIPLNKEKNLSSGFLKIGTRRSMECSVVSLAYHIQADSTGNMQHAGIAIGSVAPTIKYTQEACKYLLGKNQKKITKENREVFAKKIVDYASPISDIRATEWYRKEVLFNISKTII